MTARYDGHADWYDTWAQSEGAAAMAEARAVLERLMPSGSGLAIDVGCGTGLHADVARHHGFDVVGVDVSEDQLRLARRRLPVICGNARALPFADGSTQLVCSMLTHTDLAGYDKLVDECVRVLAPGGALIHVGVHPCFVGPFVEHLPDGVRLHPGYRERGWKRPTAFTGTVVRARVGVHHLPLGELLSAFLHRETRVEAVIEGGGGPVPELLGVRLSRM